MFVFKKKNCILHHFAFLDWLPARIFLTPIYPLLDPKTPLFSGRLAPFSHVSHAWEGFYLYHCGEFLCFLSCIQHHFALHLAPFYLAFCTKTHCIQHQNALRLAAYCTAFSTKTHSILRQIAPKSSVNTNFLNKNSFCLHSHATPFCIKTNFRENRFFAARLAIGHEFRSHSVKIYAEKITLSGVP